ncbi:hypothetical protein [Fuerstiella marisgermanici]|uniref:Uncharacterized protein n=1 Tax=Fuerstiella marisgermanici TaxID=1891926 RepID=A0A1P8WKI5_9PLAN|nr:hypothetical protein [Fuerstiella marisgermanici]APZ94574.1 hypothetical protein Fuma_04206 [Fuerstiella marisgermanici]
MSNGRDIADEELLEQCRITQIFFNRQLAYGHSPRVAYANAIRLLSRVCVFAWESISLDPDHNRIRPQLPQPAGRAPAGATAIPDKPEEARSDAQGTYKSGSDYVRADEA